ncbi:MAG: class I SAM-dependent methyltransferase [Pyrinomonadaceae bacterium]|nr:class I SAM-dependent methyltransferase [Pyrinomonadaceae bacterium]
MTSNRSDSVFAESVPEFYETYLVPLIFDYYAKDMARRVSSEPVGRVLEIAAGTGAVTRAIVDATEPGVSIVATDLNQAMLDFASSGRPLENVTWQKADALSLPFEAASFDAVVCQFSAMFFPDRPQAYSEALRMLKPGGRFIFSVWDRIEENHFAETVTESLKGLFPNDPPRFLERTPHGYFDLEEVVSDLKIGGFIAIPDIETIESRSKADKPSIPAIAYCQGTPLRNEIENRNGSILGHATDVATAALANRFGEGAVDGKIQGHVLSVRA